MNKKQKWELYLKIVERAEELDIGFGDRMTKMMDIELADNKWELRLEDWLNADNLNFAHDFVGIQSHIDRASKTFATTWLPRFATV